MGLALDGLLYHKECSSKVRRRASAQRAEAAALPPAGRTRAASAAIGAGSSSALRAPSGLSTASARKRSREPLAELSQNTPIEYARTRIASRVYGSDSWDTGPHEVARTPATIQTPAQRQITAVPLSTPPMFQFTAGMGTPGVLRELAGSSTFSIGLADTPATTQRASRRNMVHASKQVLVEKVREAARDVKIRGQIIQRRDAALSKQDDQSQRIIELAAELQALQVHAVLDEC